MLRAIGLAAAEVRHQNERRNRDGNADRDRPYAAGAPRPRRRVLGPNRPVPGSPIVTRRPRGPTVYHAPRPPIEMLAPLLLKFTRKPGKMPARRQNLRPTTRPFLQPHARLITVGELDANGLESGRDRSNSAA
jgi:hypothetical protein